MSKITPFILIIFSVVIFFTFVDPHYQSIKTLRAEKAQYDEVLAKAKTLLSKRDDLQKRYREVPAEDLARIEAMLPGNLDNVKLVLDIDRIASSYGIAVKNISVNDGKEGNGERKVVVSDANPIGVATITFGVSAPYPVFQKFLRDLEDGLRLVDITSLTVDPKGATSNGAYAYNVTFKTYWLK